jgi:hypothetical protein
MYDNGEKDGCCYRSEVFVEWLNIFVFSDSLIKTKVLESNVENWDENIPSVFF